MRELKLCPKCGTPVECEWGDTDIIVPCLCKCGEQNRMFEELTKRKTEAGIPPRFQGMCDIKNTRAQKYIQTYQKGDWTILLQYPEAETDAAAIANYFVENDEDVIYQNAHFVTLKDWLLKRIQYLVLTNVDMDDESIQRIIEWRHSQSKTTIIAGNSKFHDAIFKEEE